MEIEKERRESGRERSYWYTSISEKEEGIKKRKLKKEVYEGVTWEMDRWICKNANANHSHILLNEICLHIDLAPF